MSVTGRVILGIATLMIAVGFGIIGAMMDDQFPAGPWPMYGLAMFCSVVTLACFVPQSQPVTLRVIGVVLFLVYVIYFFASIGGQDMWLALTGFVVIGLPAGYLAITGKYPWWGQASDAFNGSEEKAEQNIVADEFRRANP